MLKTKISVIGCGYVNADGSEKGKVMDLKYLKNLVKRDINITEYLKKKDNLGFNTSKIIEIAYDLQAGSYIEFSEKNDTYMKQYSEWASHILELYVEKKNRSIIDAGTGEITTFSYLMESLNNKGFNLTPYCFDISWSRIYAGKKWIKNKFQKCHFYNAFCGDLLSIPCRSSSIDIVTTFHALEPNGGKEREILREILRVSKKWVFLFEPSYENNSSEGKQRMEKLGYIKGLPELIKTSGAKIIDIIPFPNPINPLNPTHAYVIQPIKLLDERQSSEVRYTVPGTDLILEHHKDSYYSVDEGISYPIISEIPILKNELAILSTYKGKA